MLPIQFLADPCEAIDRVELFANSLSQRFTDTSSTVLEMQTVLWGVSVYRRRFPEPVRGGLRLYTDSQSVAGLLGRRASLEAQGYRSSGSGLLSASAALYRQFYAAVDELGFEVVKVAGHSPSGRHDTLQKIFSVVDRSARRELRRWLHSLKVQD